MRPYRVISILSVLALGGVLGATPVVAESTVGATPAPTGVGAASRALLFSSDGMRPDLMERYAAAGAMAT